MNTHETSISQLPASAPGQPFVAYTAVPKVERWLEEQLRKVPITLPDGWPANMVRLAPWAWLAVLPIQAFALLGLLWVTALGAVLGNFGVLSLTLGLAGFACEVVALPGLFKRTRRGWEFTFYSSLLMAFDSLLSLSLLELALSALVLWLAMVVKPEYHA